jgi:formylglycine-generating enzyme required for sulfatase activity
MPPKEKGERLSKEESEILKNWINGGAFWPSASKLVARKREGKKLNEALIVADIYKRIIATTKEPVEMVPYKGTTTGLDGLEVSFEMVPIPGGKFKMGSPESEKGHSADEGPQKEVEIAPFWMGKYEVTWDEYDPFIYVEDEQSLRKLKKLAPSINAIIDATARPTKPYVEMSFGMGKQGYPAISMTQHAALKYCQWLSAKTGHFYRLPTEAEWEYAARAGTTTAYYWGDDASKLGEYAWWGRNSDFKYQKVGKKKPNPWGLHDMTGNVIEWTLDQYEPAGYGKLPSVNPWNKPTLPYPHSARGGSWDDEDPTKLRIAARRASNAEWKRQDPQLPQSIWFHTDAQFLGFRLVRPAKVPTEKEMFNYWNTGVEKDDSRLEK